jgi:hypothetical protein
MNILYIYSIKSNDKKTKNTVKRRFYYNFNKTILKKTNKIFRSAFYTDEKNEVEIDQFFNEYNDWIEVFKSKINSFEYIINKNKIQ